ncbi:hypothetical protein Adt_08280 [Abeliophyllum distichum]|uniref:Uncharacterized protein n=1 Tax=Abeliophyllum distichum TaxID=126358 RepID=A0ABD1VC56_9LAMI
MGNFWNSQEHEMNELFENLFESCTQQNLLWKMYGVVSISTCLQVMKGHIYAINQTKRCIPSDLNIESEEEDSPLDDAPTKLSSNGDRLFQFRKRCVAAFIEGRRWH